LRRTAAASGLKRHDDMRAMKTVFMFSGQGSQYYQMGKQLFEADQVFRARMIALDADVLSLTGMSVVEALYAPTSRPGVPFQRTVLSHPAIVMVELALAQTLIASGLVPDLVLGASLGAYAAAAVAGVMTARDAVALAVAHAQALEGHAPAGGMVAVLAAPALLGQAFAHGRIELASVNFDSHFVVSAPEADCNAFELELRRRDLTFQRLAVSFAFHSRWMDDARQPFAAAARRIRLSPARVPMLCCAQARMPAALSDTYFWDVTRDPIRFPETIARLERDGACRYIDIGPSGTLAMFLKYLLPRSSSSVAHCVMTPYARDVANMAALLDTCRLGRTASGVLA
jgi:bacillaene synthase trans-acting acyltransferase